MSKTSDRLVLVLGYKNYSSWSLRPYLAMKAAGLAFEEIVIPLYLPEAAAALAAHSPTAKVPVLKHGERIIWDSLSICEYVNELAPQARLWPADAAARAMARSAAAEMHSGFVDLRRERPMNVRARFPARPLSAAVQADVARIDALWCACRARFGAAADAQNAQPDKGFLFGGFSIADAMFGPVVSRFITYAVPLSPMASGYVRIMAGFAPMQAWATDAAAEAWHNDAHDKIFD
jgi:glutathione S-transferase